ncbi:YagK/YfjJ domain-containing protein [Vreelandella sulfidaeris]
MISTQRLRHQDNDKLCLHYDNYYEGFEVQQKLEYGPLVKNYLKATVNEIIAAVNSQQRILIFRADLHFPQWMLPSGMHQNNEVLSTFFRYFKYEIKKSSSPYLPFLRYVWAREQDTSNKPHYHLIIMLNYNVFNGLGMIQPNGFGEYLRDNLYHRMMRSWYKAMGFSNTDSLGQLIHIGEHPITEELWVATLGLNDWMGLNDAVYNASYLCKQYTKRFGEGIQVFNTSQDR